MADGFVSQAQRDKWVQLVRDGKVTQDQFDRRESATADNVPVRATPRQRTVGPSRAPDAAKYGDNRY